MARAACPGTGGTFGLSVNFTVVATAVSASAVAQAVAAFPPCLFSPNALTDPASVAPSPWQPPMHNHRVARATMSLCACVEDPGDLSLV